ncbi:MAG: phosphoadenylyl-sulfate reductase [Bacteroidetes bacterium]|nr:MAG: phosphoadenylyl-sulfate reductase [Bacteroidota bacterium]
MNWIAEETERIGREISRLKAEGKKIVSSSSFQSHSIPLLHLISRIDNSIPIYFLNTGFHFAETIAYKNEISELFQLNTIDLHSATEKLFQKDSMDRFLYASEPTYCCFINKILPMDEVLKVNDVWIAGVRKDQTGTRSKFNEYEGGPHDTTRFHPILSWTSKMIHEYQTMFNLPVHPLESQGYLSVGCEPCTSKYISSERGGRWQGLKKEECGLHTDLVAKK